MPPRHLRRSSWKMNMRSYGQDTYLGGRDVRYLLRATFNAADQGYADAQVLDIAAEGVKAGQLTVVETDGTLAIVSNKMAFTAQGTPGWGDQGAYSQAITRALGRGLLGTVNIDATTEHISLAWDGTAAARGNDGLYVFYLGPLADLRARGSVGGTPIIGGYSASTDYTLAVVLGGCDSNELPYYAGQANTNYAYGCWYFVKGGAYTTWTLLWIEKSDNTATLYTAFSNYSAAGTLDDFRVPDRDLSSIQVPAAYSSFTAANGTSLEAITPEVGGAWTHQQGTFQIQSNRMEKNSGVGEDKATVDAGVADCIVKAIIHQEYTDASNQELLALAVRYSDTTHFWMITISPDDDTVEIWENDAGYTKRADAAVTINGNTDYDVTAILDGQQIDAFVDGANKASYGSAALNETATIHGVRYVIVGTPPDTAELDNFIVYPRTDSDYDTVLDGV